MCVWFSVEAGKDFLKRENGGRKYYHCMGKSVNISIIVGQFIVENFVQKQRDLLFKAFFFPFGKAGKGAFPLRNRGNLTLWLSPSAIKFWIPKSSGKPGRQQKYSDLAIETVLILRLLFHLPLRQAEGFVSSLFQLMGLLLSIQDQMRWYLERES